jgi:predicted dehydrogenase
MNKVRSGVIGIRLAGDVHHIPAVQSHLLTELVAVQSRERAKAEKIAREFRAKHACTTVKEIQEANQWPNRMIGDEQQPADCEFG